MKISISRRFTFEAAHFLPGHPGKCANLHGHRFELIVQIGCEEANLVDGMVMDYSNLKEIVEREVIDCYDHQNLNDKIPFNDSVKFPMRPTSENLARLIFNYLSNTIERFTNRRAKHEKIILKETENSTCEVTE